MREIRDRFEELAVGLRGTTAAVGLSANQLDHAAAVVRACAMLFEAADALLAELDDRELLQGMEIAGCASQDLNTSMERVQDLLAQAEHVDDVRGAALGENP